MRMNHIGTIWIVSSLPRVAKLEMMVIERILSISAELSEGGLTFSALELETITNPIPIHITYDP
jgi:hypothetical protein